MEDAINLEVNRQIRVLEDGGKIMQETRLYNGVTKKSQSMRSKEEANDYRYFPCPDLLPVHVSKEFINNLRKDLPELPENKKNRYKEQYGLSEYDANGLTENFLFAKFLRTVCSCLISQNFLLTGY